MAPPRRKTSGPVEAPLSASPAPVCLRESNIEKWETHDDQAKKVGTTRKKSASKLATASHSAANTAENATNLDPQEQVPNLRQKRDDVRGNTLEIPVVLMIERALMPF